MDAKSHEMIKTVGLVVIYLLFRKIAIYLELTDISFIDYVSMLILFFVVYISFIVEKQL